MAPKKQKTYADDVPWRKGTAGEKPVPRIGSLSAGVSSVHLDPNFDYAMSILKHPDPIGVGLANEIAFECGGSDCLIPGLVRPTRVLGLQVWPLPFSNPINLRAIEKTLGPIGRELKTFNEAVERVLSMAAPPQGRR